MPDFEKGAALILEQNEAVSANSEHGQAFGENVSIL